MRERRAWAAHGGIEINPRSYSSREKRHPGLQPVLHTVHAQPTPRARRVALSRAENHPGKLKFKTAREEDQSALQQQT